MRYTVRRNLISRNPEINKKKKGEAAGVGTPACTYTNICQICCLTSTLFRASLLESRLLWPCFELERIISCPLFLLFGSPFPSPFKVRSKFGRFLFPFHPQPLLPGPFGNLKQPMVNQLGLASIFFCMLIYQAISLVN